VPRECPPSVISSCPPPAAGGCALALVVERWPPTRFVRSFAAIGFLGAYTTFSTFGVEADRLVSTGRALVALAYVSATLGAGLVAVYAGIALARAWSGPGVRPR
jgi:CrcB protein